MFYRTCDSLPVRAHGHAASLSALTVLASALTWRACVLQTYIGSILAAVNPYQLLPGLYDRPAVERYSRHHLGEMPPHIFAVANECYRSLWKRQQSQCVLIR